MGRERRPWQIIVGRVARGSVALGQESQMPPAMVSDQCGLLDSSNFWKLEKDVAEALSDGEGGGSNKRVEESASPPKTSFDGCVQYISDERGYKAPFEDDCSLAKDQTRYVNKDPGRSQR